MATGTLAAQTIANTYKSLLKVTGTTAGGETLHATTVKEIEDGDGNLSPFRLSQQRIEITSAGTSTTMFNITDNADASLFDVDTTNKRVGIGTATPDTRLEVAADSSSGTILSVTNYSDTSASACASLAFKTADGTEEVPVASDNGDHLGAISFAGWHADSLFTIGPSILGKCTGSVSDGVMPSELQFHTNPGAGAVNRFTITSAGVCSGDLDDTSDVNLKKNIVSISEGLSIVNQLNPVIFDWKEEIKGSNQGFIAQEVEKILPNIVSGKEIEEDGDTGKAINVTGIVASLTKAIQELSAKVTALESA